jgi:hypothetical protein
VIIPNEYLVSNIVRNESFTDSRVRVMVSVQVAYGTDLEQAMRLMNEAAQAQPRVLADPPPQVLLTAFADSGINLDLGFWIADPQEGTGGVRSAINMAIWRSFREHGIEIPFPATRGAPDRRYAVSDALAWPIAHASAQRNVGKKNPRRNLRGIESPSFDGRTGRVKPVTRRLAVMMFEPAPLRGLPASSVRRTRPAHRRRRSAMP